MRLSAFPSLSLRFLSACIRFRVNPATALKRYSKLYHEDMFSPDEIHYLRLLDPTVYNATIKHLVSKERMLEPQNRLNPVDFRHYIDDKIIFDRQCTEYGLSTPEVVAILDAAGGTYSSGKPVLTSEREIAQFLQNTRATRLVFKPVDGHDGIGVDRLEKHKGSWRDFSGKRLTAAMIHARTLDTNQPRWMFQQVIDNHPKIQTLSGARGLQTIRVRTAINNAGEPEILGALLRLISGENAYDNFRGGRTGNLLAILDPSNGSIVEVDGSCADYHEHISVTHHPVTKEPLIGFSIPLWEEVQTVTLRAAKSFLPLRTIGWDIAVTSSGPVFIEGNLTWGTRNRERDVYEYLMKLCNDAASE